MPPSPPETRASLIHLDEVPIAEAARQLGISIGAVYIARNRVMSRLRELAQQFEVQP